MSNQNRPAVDLTRYHFAAPHKDLMVIGTWLYNSDMEDDEPCIVIVPRYRQRGFTPVCIALSAAYRYNSAKYTARITRAFNHDLGFEDTIANSHKVADAIYNNLLALLAMPPSPTTSIVVGQAVITEASGNKLNVELLEHLPTQQS